MIKVIVSNNLKRETHIISPDTTLRQAFEQAGVNYFAGVNSLDMAPLSPGDMDKTFAAFGYTGEPGHDSCYLTSIAKANNAFWGFVPVD